MNKLTVLSLGLLSAAGLGLSPAHASVKLVLDESTTLGMVDNSTYNLSNNLIEVSLDRPVLCNKVAGYNPTGITKLKVYDPNLEMKGGFPGSEGIYLTNANYQVTNGFFHLDTDNPLKALCVSADVGNFDLIYKDPFEDVSISTDRVEYVGLPSIVSPGQILDYDIKFSNNSGVSVTFDLLEYWPQRTDFNAYISANTNTRQCNGSNPNVNCVVTNPESGVMKNITLATGGELIVNVTQEVSYNAVPGSELDFMTAIFMIDGNGSFKPRAFTENPVPYDPHVVSHTASVQNNTPPTIEWVQGSEPASLTSFYEDEMTAQEFDIEYGDNETTAADLTVTFTNAIGNILSVTKSGFTAVGLNGRRTVTVMPLANAYTDNDNEEITVTVTDAAGGEASLTFAVHVTPVNDAPTITLSCTDVVINSQLGTTECLPGGSGNQLHGVWNYNNFATDFDEGPNERQDVLTYQVELVNNDDGLLDTVGNGNGSGVDIDTGNGKLKIHVNNGVYGTAQVRIRVQDDGGGIHGPEGCVLPLDPAVGCDVSEWQTLNITSEPFKYTVGGETSGVPIGSQFLLTLTGFENGDPVTSANVSISTTADPHEFDFSQLLDDQSAYTVTIISAPNDYNCSENNNTGTISGGNVSNVEITCTIK